MVVKNAAIEKSQIKDTGNLNVSNSQALNADPNMPIPTPINIVSPRKEPRFSGENIFANKAIQAGEINPDPILCHVKLIKNMIKADFGSQIAMIADMIINQIGIRSKNNPHPTQNFFIFVDRSMNLAANNCGMNHPADVMTLTKPIGIKDVVNLLMKSGMIVVIERKLYPNQKVAPSRKLTVKFQR